MSKLYRLFGLTIASDRTLPDLPVAEDNTTVDVDVRERPSIAIEADELTPVEGGAVLSIAGVARYEVTAGRSMFVTPDPAADPGDVRLYLLGSAMGLLLYQRGLMPLHANAVVVDSRAFAFAGASGAGKSTLAAWFVRRGLPLLTDDVCVIVRPSNSPPLVVPGPRRLRLWRDAVEVHGADPDCLPRSFPSLPDHDKYDVVVPAAQTFTSAVPLGAIFVLADGEELDFQRLSGLAAAEELFAHSYRGAFAHLSGIVADHFTHCVALARDTPVFRLIRPRRHSDQDAQGETILAAIADPAFIPQ
jgi:hypothetical protein